MSTQIYAAYYSNVIRTPQKKASLWNVLKIEGVVVSATIDQSMPSFDKSQKQELERECVCMCVCVSILHTHTVRQHCFVVCSVVGWHTEGKWELWKLCWRNAAGKLKVCENLLEKKVEVRGGGEGQVENVHWSGCKKKKWGKAPGKSKRRKMWGETSLRWAD